MVSFPYAKAIVVGASSGVGEQIARQLAGQGCKVAIVGRRLSRLQTIANDINGTTLDLVLPIEHDVLDHENAETEFQAIVHKLEGLDIIFYCAGVMPHVEMSEYSIEKDKLIVETNLIGAMAWLNAAAKRFERTSSGTIVGIGSVSGDRGRKGNPAYGASKAGFECYLESLRNRLAEKGVNVVTVKPGPIATEMTSGRGKLPGMITPEKAAELIISASRKRNKTIYIPMKWWLVSKIMRLIPSVIFRRLKI